MSNSPGHNNQQSNLFSTPMLVIGSFGCGFLMCGALLLGAVSLFADEQTERLLTELVMLTPPPTAPAAISAEVPAVIPSATSAPTSTATGTPTNQPTPTNTSVLPTEVIPPQFGPITFALDATDDDYTPIDPGHTFEEGITEIHAVFEYSGMADSLTWERVWFQDGEELLRSREAWAGYNEGRFDYFIDAGGRPLPPGDWRLALYVESNLLVSGTFTITPKFATPTATPTPTRPADPLADLPRSTPIVPAANETLLGTQTYQLLFTRWDGVEHDVFVADTNGNGAQFLLSRAAGPSWTPDGQQMFVYGEAGVDRQFLPDGREFVFDGISNGIVSLTNAAARPDMSDAILFQDISWKQGRGRWANVSPTGRMVAYDATIDANSGYRIYFISLENDAPIPYQIIGEQADWSPNGEQLVYRSGRNGLTGLWISNRTDSGHRSLTNGGSDSFPSWSPDGQTIAFSRDAGNNVDIYTISVNGTNLARLTDAPGPDTLPVYTPDGNLIFRSARDGRWSIWKMDGAGQGQTEIIANAPVGPDWAFSRMDVR